MATKAAKSLVKAGTKAAGRKAARKAGVRAAAKVGGKVALKIGAKAGAATVAPVGVVLMTAEGLPVFAEEVRDIRGRSRERYRLAKDAYRRGEYLEAAKRGAKGVLQTDLDIARGIGRTALAAFTAKELADMTRREKKEIRRAVSRAKQNGNLAWAEGLLAAMLALRTAYQYSHWNARNYADHLLFERLYKSLDADIDTLAELTVRATGRVAPLFAKIRPDNVETAEGQIIAVASEAVKAGQDYDMDNYLMTLIEHRRRALYLLHQRSR